jgi:hypothetical protein
LTIEGETLLVGVAIKKAKDILKEKKDIYFEDTEYNFVLWIFRERRPHIIPDNTLIFKVAEGADNRNNCFWYKYQNNGWESFSYKKAFEPQSSKINSTDGESIISKGDYLKAFRNCVYEEIKAFREKELKKNARFSSLSKQDPFNIHTDHVIPLHILISDFLKDRNLKLKDVELKKIQKFNTDSYILKDEILRSNWIEYHKTHARLKLVTKQENLSKAGSQDIPLYNYKKRRFETYD